MHESKTVEMAKQGDPVAIDTLYHSSLSALRATVRRVLRNFPDDIEDSIQSAWALAFTRLSTFDGGCPFSAWLCVIGRHEALSFLRRSRARINPVSLSSNSEDGLDLEIPTRHRGFGHFEAVRQLAQMWPHLQPRQQLYLQLHYIQGLKQGEIAKLYGVSVNSVKSTIYRGLRRAQESSTAKICKTHLTT
jgi:RNA polymerase sigma factor (sigma-70 family)